MTQLCTIYKSKLAISESLRVDPRTVENYIKEKKIIVCDIEGKIRYIITKDIFTYLSN
jgi:hypothetical protein